MQVRWRAYSEVENEFAPKSPPYAVKQGSIPKAVDVALNVTRIEPVQQIEHGNTGPHVQLAMSQAQRERTSDLKIERREAR